MDAQAVLVNMLILLDTFEEKLWSYHVALRGLIRRIVLEKPFLPRFQGKKLRLRVSQ